MIRKIICPIDFSPASENAVHYAAHLCQVLGTSLNLSTVESVYLTSMMIPPVYFEQENLTTVEMLEYICDYIRSSYHISCDYELFISNHSIARTLEEKGTGDHLIVMGTSTKLSLFKRCVGSTTYRFIRKTSYPLLMVPENVSYHSIQNVILASKEISNIHSSVLELIKNKLNPSLMNLHIYPQETSEKGINQITESGVDCDSMFSSNTFRGIHHYMLYKQADLLIVIDKKRGFLNKLFHSSVIKKLSRQHAYPVLVLKEND